MNSFEQKLLALDPGTKEMGIALFHGTDLFSYRVKTFRNGRKPHALLTQARDTMVKLLEEGEPDVVVIEKPFFARTKRSALLTFLVQELRERIGEGRVTLHEYTPREVRAVLLGRPNATKRDIARFVAGRFPELARYAEPTSHWQEKYWSHVFDAAALGLAELIVRTRAGQAPS